MSTLLHGAALSHEEKLFALGNYASAAAGDPGGWHTHAARGLLGRCRPALEALAEFDEPEARFYSAAIHWIDGDDEAAADLLLAIPGEPAAILRALIAKPKIRVVSQWVRCRAEPFDFLSAAAHDTHFDIQDMGFYPQDPRSLPNTSIHKCIDTADPPDFFICDRLEWQAIPPDIQELGCPVFGRTEEYDLLIQSCRPWLKLFDGIVTGDATAWEDVRRLSGAPTVIFPKTLGLPAALPPVPPGRRVNDLLLSSLAGNPYHTDRAALVEQVLRLKEVRARFVEGSMASRIYHELLGGTRLYVAHHRRAGAIPPDALDALSMGCAVLVPKGSLLALYAGEDQGVYEYETPDLAARVTRILQDWPAVEASAHRGAAWVRREFSAARGASQYLRFLAFLAAASGSPAARKAAPRPVRKRPVLARGWTVGLPALQRAQQVSSEHWTAELQKQVRLGTLNDLAREVLLQYATAVEKGLNQAAPPELLDGVLTLYRSGVRKFPQSLVLRFNLLRALLHFGRERDAAEALHLAADTLRRPAGQWVVAPEDDVLPYDFFGRFFNYRAYLDLAVSESARGKAAMPRATPLIRASMHYYVGRHSDSLASLRQAVALDPRFPWYAFTCAQQLARHGSHEEAGRLLLQLTKGSALFLEAADLLEELRSKRLFDAPDVDAALQAATRARQQGLIPEDRWSEVL